MRASGYTAVGEFHYSASPRRTRLTRPPRLRASSSSLLHVAYARGGLPLQAGVGRGVPPRGRGATGRRGRARASRPTPSGHALPDWLEEIGRYAEREGLLLHVHANEQPREVEECLAEHGCRPIELLARTGASRVDDRRPRHARGRGRARPPGVVRRDGVRMPDHGGGSRRRLPAGRAHTHAVDPALNGSDSNVRIDPFEELRELEGIARRQTGRAGSSPPESSFASGARGSARSASRPGPGSRSTSPHRSLAGVARDDVSLPRCSPAVRPTSPWASRRRRGR